MDAQHRWARAFHRRVTGSQTRLANTTPATAAIRLDCDTPSSFSAAGHHRGQDDGAHHRQHEPADG